MYMQLTKINAVFYVDAVCGCFAALLLMKYIPILQTGSYPPNEMHLHGLELKLTSSLANNLPPRDQMPS